MISLSVDKKLQILCVNQDIFAYHPSKLVSFELNAFFNIRLIKLFDYFKNQKSLEDTIKFILSELNVSYSQVEIVLTYLIKKGILKVHDGVHDQEEIWVKNNWSEAVLFHLHTNSLPKMMYNTVKGEKEDIILMKNYLGNEKPPSNYKTYFYKSIKLEKPEINKTYNVLNTLSPRKKSVKLTIQILSRLLYYAFGEIGTRHMIVTGEHIRKTVPSGGARHPIEAYLFIADIEGVDSGIYHYSVKSHALSLVKAVEKDVIFNIIKTKFLLDENRPGFNYSIAIAYSCMFARSMFRYRESRSYRVMHFDMGHITQNLCFLAEAYHLNLYCGYSCREKEIEKFIGLDSLMESIIAYTVM